MFKKQILRSPYQSLAAIMVITLSLFLISLSVFLGFGLQSILVYFESRPQVSAFLKDEIKPEEVELIKQKVTGLENVKEIQYISKEQALEIYKEQNKDKPLLLEMVTVKTLPASLEVSTKDLSSLKAAADLLKNESMIEDVIFQEDVVSSLSKWVNSIRNGSIFLGSYLLLMSVLIVLVTVSMKISQRRDELEILKLLGASNWYIRRPFLIEGVFYGSMAAILSWLISYGLIIYEVPYLKDFLNGIVSFPLPFTFMLEVLGGLILSGCFIGLIGSLLAVSRFGRAVR